MTGVFGDKLKHYKSIVPFCSRVGSQKSKLGILQKGYFFNTESLKFMGFEERHFEKLVIEVDVKEVNFAGAVYLTVKSIKEMLEEEKQPVIIDKPNLKLDNFLECVEEFHKCTPFFYDHSHIFWIWSKENYCYSMVDDIDLMNMIEHELGFYGATVKNGIKTSYIEAFKRVGRRNHPETAPDTWVQCKTKIHDIGTGEVFEATPKYFLTNPIPWEALENAECPIIDKCFEEWAGKENVRLLKQIVGFCMVPKYFLHRIFCFTGSGRNGKTTYMDLIKKAIGKENTCSTDLDDLMNSRFESAKLYKKLVCLMGETNFNTMSRTSKLKKLCGGDLISYEFKNKMPFDDYNYAKLLISTNGLPQTTDKTEGFYRRWELIDFPNKFSEKKDILATIPDEEYKALIGQVIEEVKIVWREREFSNQTTVEERMRKYEAHSNPLLKFIENNVEEDVNGFIFCHEFRDKFHEFCQINGFRKWNDREIGVYMNSEKFEKTKKPSGTFNEKGQEKRWYAYLDVSLCNLQNLNLNLSSTGPMSSLSSLSGLFNSEPRKGDSNRNIMDKLDKLDMEPVPPEFSTPEKWLMEYLYKGQQRIPIETIWIYLQDKMDLSQFDDLIKRLKEQGQIMEEPAGQIQILQ